MDEETGENGHVRLRNVGTPEAPDMKAFFSNQECARRKASKGTAQVAAELEKLRRLDDPEKALTPPQDERLAGFLKRARRSQKKGVNSPRRNLVRGGWSSMTRNSSFGLTASTAMCLVTPLSVFAR